MRVLILRELCPVVRPRAKGIVRPAPATSRSASGRNQPSRSCSAEPARRFRLCRRVSPAADSLLLAAAESTAGTRASGFSPALGLCVRPLVTQSTAAPASTAHGRMPTSPGQASGHGRNIARLGRGLQILLPVRSYNSVDDSAWPAT